MFTRIADDYVFKQVRVTHSSVLDFDLLLLLGVSRVKREREKERKREYSALILMGKKEDFSSCLL